MIAETAEFTFAPLVSTKHESCCVNNVRWLRYLLLKLLIFVAVCLVKSVNTIFSLKEFLLPNKIW